MGKDIAAGRQFSFIDTLSKGGIVCSEFCQAKLKANCKVKPRYDKKDVNQQSLERVLIFRKFLKRERSERKSPFGKGSSAKAREGFW